MDGMGCHGDARDIREYKRLSFERSSPEKVALNRRALACLGDALRQLYQVRHRRTKHYIHFSKHRFICLCRRARQFAKLY